MDAEGSPVQELSGVAINARTKAFEGVFHEYADFCASDNFARRHIHGLNRLFLNKHSVGSETILFDRFRKWLNKFNIKAIYANDPQKEQAILNRPVLNFPLHIWVERRNKRYHRQAITCKNISFKINGRTFCPKEAHSDYVCTPHHRNPEIKAAKKEHGYHCSLYDTMELVMAFREQ